MRMEKFMANIKAETKQELNRQAEKRQEKPCTYAREVINLGLKEQLKIEIEQERTKLNLLIDSHKKDSPEVIKQSQLIDKLHTKLIKL